MLLLEHTAGFTCSVQTRSRGRGEAEGQRQKKATDKSHCATHIWEPCRSGTHGELQFHLLRATPPTELSKGLMKLLLQDPAEVPMRRSPVSPDASTLDLPPRGAPGARRCPPGPAPAALLSWGNYKEKHSKAGRDERGFRGQTQRPAYVPTGP